MSSTARMSDVLSGGKGEEEKALTLGIVLVELEVDSEGERDDMSDDAREGDEEDEDDEDDDVGDVAGFLPTNLLSIRSTSELSDRETARAMPFEGDEEEEEEEDEEEEEEEEAGEEAGEETEGDLNMADKFAEDCGVSEPTVDDDDDVDDDVVGEAMLVTPIPLGADHTDEACCILVESRQVLATSWESSTVEAPNKCVTSIVWVYAATE